MILSYIWCIMMIIVFLQAFGVGSGDQVSRAFLEGANQAITLSITIAGPICLWSGIGRLMEKTGLNRKISCLFHPVLRHIFPTASKDTITSGYICSNICANMLGIGNAATPMGIQAVGRMRDPKLPDRATDEICRLVVMNTASIQLIPTTVAVVRQSAGSGNPMDLLPCVWLTSFFSVSVGLTACFILERFDRYA